MALPFAERRGASNFQRHTEGKADMLRLQPPTSIDKRRYGWGLMVTIHVGIMFSIPLHPEHQAAILRVAASGECETIRDESGRVWSVDPVPGHCGVTLTSGSDAVPLLASQVQDA